MLGLDVVLYYLLFSVLGVLVAAPLSMVPGLHVYNVMGFALLAYLPFAGTVDPMLLIMFMMGLLTGYAVMNTIMSIYLSTPDDSTIFIVLPGQKYLLQGRAHEAVLLTGAGSLMGIAFLVVVIPLAMGPLVLARAILTPHLWWIIALIIAFMIMAEWPKDFGTNRTRLGRLADGWSTLTFGLLTFFLSGFLGMIIMYRQVVPVESAFQGIMPALVGLFAVPWVLTNMISEIEIPEQHICRSTEMDAHQALRGGAAGCVGGLFGAFFPTVTGGIAGMLAGHATAQRDDKMFIISQGASKVVYYVGAVLLLFIPGLHLSRGGAAIMINLFFVPETEEQFYLLVAAVALCGALSFLLLLGLSRLAIKLVTKVDYRKLSFGTLFVIIGIVGFMTSWQGLLIMAVAAAIGLIPVMFHSRRMNCMGVLLLPICLNLAGVGPQVAGFLGLL